MTSSRRPAEDESLSITSATNSSNLCHTHIYIYIILDTTTYYLPIVRMRIDLLSDSICNTFRDDLLDKAKTHKWSVEGSIQDTPGSSSAGHVSSRYQ